MLELHCSTCTYPLMLQIEVKNLLAYYKITLHKNTLKPNIREILAENPKIETKNFFCRNCNKIKENNEMTLRCHISSELVPLDNIELIEVKGDIKDTVAIKKNTLNDEEVLKKLVKHNYNNLNIQITRLPPFTLRKEL